MNSKPNLTQDAAPYGNSNNAQVASPPIPFKNLPVIQSPMTTNMHKITKKIMPSNSSLFKNDESPLEKSSRFPVTPSLLIAAKRHLHNVPSPSDHQLQSDDMTDRDSIQWSPNESISSIQLVDSVKTAQEKTTKGVAIAKMKELENKNNWESKCLLSTDMVQSNADSISNQEWPTFNHSSLTQNSPPSWLEPDHLQKGSQNKAKGPNTKKSSKQQRKVLEKVIKNNIRNISSKKFQKELYNAAMEMRKEDGFSKLSSNISAMNDPISNLSQLRRKVHEVAYEMAHEIGLDMTNEVGNEIGLEMALEMAHEIGLDMTDRRQTHPLNSSNIHSKMVKSNASNEKCEGSSLIKNVEPKWTENLSSEINSKVENQPIQKLINKEPSSVLLPLSLTRIKNTIKPSVSLSDFKVIKLIGKGAFGEVYLTEHLKSHEIMALKVLKKIDSTNKSQQILNEREILVRSTKMPFLLSLRYSFQDERYLYFAMQYCPGGDLRSLLNAIGSLDEADARIYMAEVIVSVDGLHKLGYIHRDLKPDNFLIDDRGHLVLADFGLSSEHCHALPLEEEDQSLSNLKEKLKKDGEMVNRPVRALTSILLGEQMLEELNINNINSRFRRTRDLNFKNVQRIPQLMKFQSNLTAGNLASKIITKDKLNLINLDESMLKTNYYPHHMTSTCKTGGGILDPLDPTRSQLKRTGWQMVLNRSYLKTRKIMAYSMVGSPDYMSPEVLAKRGYGYEVDWWSVGCLFFELLVGVPPFSADTIEEVFYNINCWEKRLPDILSQHKSLFSNECFDLISSLLCDLEVRAGTRGVDDFKSHPFFSQINWDDLYSCVPPFVPILENQYDTSYFDDRVASKEEPTMLNTEATEEVGRSKGTHIEQFNYNPEGEKAADGVLPKYAEFTYCNEEKEN